MTDHDIMSQKINIIAEIQLILCLSCELYVRWLPPSVALQQNSYGNKITQRDFKCKHQ